MTRARSLSDAATIFLINHCENPPSSALNISACLVFTLIVPHAIKKERAEIILKLTYLRFFEVMMCLLLQSFHPITFRNHQAMSCM